MSTPEVHPSDRPNRRRTTMVIFVALVLLALTVLAVKQFGNDGADAWGGSGSPGSAAPPDATVGASGSPIVESTVIPGTGDQDPVRTVQKLPPEGIIPGVDVSAVVGVWEKRWKVALKDYDDLNKRAVIVDNPTTGGRLHLVITTTPDGTQAVAVRCIVEHGQKKVDRTLLAAVVRECFVPALEQSERAPVLDWLSDQDYKIASGIRSERKSMQRFDLTVDVMSGSLRAGLVGRP